ncbi:hypothetical protein VM1G_02415 [Cytospora mali]|uniref:YTH domain-containing protein n=1 Tax=Cytospora mali TaxID=578113 RepID=A0A194VS58_CYTMA|nr:hypothetical protein VM1G_02415 [Valsa mali]
MEILHKKKAGAEYRRPNNYRTCHLDSLMDVSDMEPCSQDFVRISKLSLRVPDWPRFLESIYRLLKPDGWVEIFDVSAVYTDETSSPWYPVSVLQTGHRNSVKDTGAALSKAGFCRVTTASERHSLNAWPGEDYVNDIYADLEWVMDGIWGYQKEEIDEFLNTLEKSDPSKASVGFTMFWASCFSNAEEDTHSGHWADAESEDTNLDVAFKHLASEV